MMYLKDVHISWFTMCVQVMQIGGVVYMQENDTSPLTMTYVPPLEANAVNLRGYCEGTRTLHVAARMC